MFKEAYELVRKHIVLVIVIAIVSAIAGAIFSSPSFIKPRYKSVAAVYPINIIPHSDESETEQMLQSLASDEIKESVLNTFELWKRWDDLKPGEPEYRHWSNLLYRERVSISPTRYESVEIVCQDESPDTAMLIVEHIISKYNEIARAKDRVIHQGYYELKSHEMSELRLVIDSLESRMRSIRINGGMLDFDSQSERLTEGYLEMLGDGASNSRLNEVKEMMANMAQDGSELEILQEMVSELKVYFTDLVQEQIRAHAKANSNLDYLHVEVSPEVPDKKAFPVRWLIVVLSLILGLLSTIIFLILWNRLRSTSPSA